MPTFTYKARDTVGRLARGYIDAEDELKAAVNIEKLGLSPIDISTQGQSYSLKNLSMIFSFKRVSRQEVLVFTRQLSTLISTGAPLIQSLNNVKDQAQNARFKQVVAGIIASLEGGLSFSAALSRYPQIFPKLYISLVRVGETAGLLDKVLARLADLSTQEIDMQSRLRSALVYPAVLASIAFLVVNFVLMGVLPKFVAIFESSSAKLPLPTKVLLSLSFLLTRYWWLLVLAVIFVASWLRNFYRTSAGRMKIDALLLRLPLFGPLLLKIMVARFSRSIAALVMSGVPVLEALGVVEATVSNVVLERIIQNVRFAISQGQSLTEPFAASGLFPPMVIQLINTGERTGRLGEMFEQIADFYDPEIEYTMRNLTSLLEPAMLLLMGAVVTFIALSVLLPIFNLISVIRR